MVKRGDIDGCVTAGEGADLGEGGEAGAFDAGGDGAVAEDFEGDGGSAGIEGDEEDAGDAGVAVQVNDKLLAEVGKEAV